MQAYIVEDRGNDISKKLTEVYLMVDSLWCLSCYIHLKWPNIYSGLIRQSLYLTWHVWSWDFMKTLITPSSLVQQQPISSTRRECWEGVEQFLVD